MKILTYKLFIIIMVSGLAFITRMIVTDNDNYKIYNDTLEYKIKSLINNHDCSVVIAGDSRAERQLIPAVIINNYNIKAINIATSGCDIITLYNALKKYNLLEKPTTFIISASFFQVNDGAIDFGNISMAQIASMSISDKFKVFGIGNSNLYKNYISLAVPEKNSLDNLGYHAVKGNLERPPGFGTDPKLTTHPWYKNINIHGVRWNIYKETLNKMAESKRCNFIIFQPPVSDSFRKYIKNSEIEKSEMEYSKLVIDEIKNYNNIHFIDYFSNNPTILSDNDYYDPQHLNDSGAKKFTIYLIQDCINKSLLR